jgi:MbtH protein
MSTDQEDDTIYLVVINAEEQYSIWPSYKPVPAGWTAVGKQGRKEDCLAHIEEVWTDMRPLSLRRQMEQTRKKPEDLRTQ